MSMKPPTGLRPSTRRWFRSVVNTYELESHHVQLLNLAAQALDEAEAAQEIIRRDGLVIPGREGGLRPHPAVAIRRDARLAFARLVQRLDLDGADAPKRAPGRPPSGYVGISYQDLHGLPSPQRKGRPRKASTWSS
jgi:phage terminase small subunit